MKTLESRKGIDGFTLKVIALLLMTLDHIHYFLSGVLPVPFWFSLLGRISAPVFLFMTANGFLHTHDRKNYMLRLYLWSVGMAVADDIANRYFMAPTGAMVINNIFATMFYIVFYLWFLEKLRAAIRERAWGTIAISAAALLVPFLISAMQLSLMGMLLQNPSLLPVMRIVSAVLPSPLLVEGSVFWIGLGIGLYYLMSKKIWMSVFYILLCGFFFWTALGNGFSFQNLFQLNNQWFMIAALPLFLLYNGKKGRGMKYFFYAYYPTHIFGLLALCHLLYG